MNIIDFLLSFPAWVVGLMAAIIGSGATYLFWVYKTKGKEEAAGKYPQIFAIVMELLKAVVETHGTYDRETQKQLLFIRAKNVLFELDYAVNDAIILFVIDAAFMAYDKIIEKMKNRITEEEWIPEELQQLSFYAASVE